MMQKIIIFGASGKTGSELVRQSLIAGHQVTAFVRDPSKITFQHPALEIFQGNVANELAVHLAIKGHDAVLSTLGASNPMKFDQTVVDGMGYILKAMEKEGIKRLIYLSVVAVKGSSNVPGFFLKNIAPLLLRNEIKGHEAREKMIRDSTLDWTIVHAPGLMNGPHTGTFRTGEEITSKGFLITASRADVADLMVRQLDDRSYIRKAVRILY